MGMNRVEICHYRQINDFKTLPDLEWKRTRGELRYGYQFIAHWFWLLIERTAWKRGWLRYQQEKIQRYVFDPERVLNLRTVRDQIVTLLKNDLMPDLIYVGGPQWYEFVPELQPYHMYPIVQFDYARQREVRRGDRVQEHFTIEELPVIVLPYLDGVIVVPKQGRRAWQ